VLFGQVKNIFGREVGQKATIPHIVEKFGQIWNYSCALFFNLCEI